MNKINNVSDVFRGAKKHLWDGESDYYGAGEEFICRAINTLFNGTYVNSLLVLQAKEIIQDRLGYNTGGARTVNDYLHDVLEIPEEELTSKKVQKYRKDWLTALEKEFKPKLK